MADEARQELKNYMKTLQKNETAFQTLKDHDQDLIQETQKLFQEHTRSRGRGLGM